MCRLCASICAQLVAIHLHAYSKWVELQKVGPSTTDNKKFRALVGLFMVYVTSGSYVDKNRFRHTIVDYSVTNKCIHIFLHCILLQV